MVTGPSYFGAGNSVLDFYRGRKVFLTGHTGFKGSWLSRILVLAGARVTGYSLEPPDTPNLWGLLGMEKEMASITGDARDFESLKKAFDAARPEIVFHMAAQPIVLEGYRDPRGTYSVNVMGTVNILECVRLNGAVRSFLNITTDKVYHNNEWYWGYRENDNLGGFDPYSNSKSCSDSVSAAYARSFFTEGGAAVSMARSGNVIGGGDFAKDRIISDCVRAAERGESVVLRNPGSVRPYQHVLEALGAYLLIAKNQLERPETAGAYNIGPDAAGCVATGKLAEMFNKMFNEMFNEAFCGMLPKGFNVSARPLKTEQYVSAGEENGLEKITPHEAVYLKLDCSKIRSVLGWKPVWDIEEAVRRVVEWEKARICGEDVKRVTDRQIDEYFNAGSAL